MRIVKLFQAGGENALSEHPLGLGYLLSNCDVPGVSISVAKTIEDLEQADLIGVSANAQGLSEAVSILEWAKVPVVIGGQGTLWEGLTDYPFAHIVRGEGEVAFREILRGDELPKVIHKPLLDDLDAIKPPDIGKCNNHFPILSSRGCPFHCSYCSSQAFWGHMRYHSVGRMMEEVECGAKLYPHSRILYILDDLVTANKPRLRRLHEAWMQGEWSKRWELSLFVRADTFDEETARMLVDMNAGRVRFGAESGSDRVLKLLGKTTTVADNQRTVDIGRKYGLDMFAAFMHHVPGETDEERQMTLDFRARNKGYLGDGGWYMYTDFPGTALYDGSNPIETRQRFRPKPGRADWDD